MNQKIKISQLPAKGSNLAAQDLLEIAEFTGTGYVSKSITGQELIDAIPAPSVEWGDIGGTLSAQTDLQTALNAKQNTLVSGTSIKTINSTSLLGSGDVAVQPTLVSGTNIKTIEGQSLLGSGNIDLTKSDVGLGNVDNTSDLNKPISTATQTALNGKENTITAGTTSQYFRGDKTFQTLDKSAVGLGNVDNTSDANKPISTATQTALNAKQNSIFVARSFTQSIGTNATGETQLLQITIPANSFSATDKLSFFASFSKTGIAFATTVRVKLSTSASMPAGTSGTIALFLSVATAQFIKLNREMSISGGNLKGFPLTTSATTDQAASSSTVSISVAFDVTQTQYLYVSAQPSALSTDVTYLEAFEIRNL